MRFKKEKTPSTGDKRIDSYFAFLPVTIDDEVRWLENVTIEEEYVYVGDWGVPFYYMWKKIRFID